MASTSDVYYNHSTAIIDDGAVIGAATKIWHFSHICGGAVIGGNCTLGQNVFIASGVIIGDNVKIQNNVSVYSGTTIESDVFLGPSCVLTNVSNPRSQINRQSLYEETRIKRGASVGANATIVCGVTIGSYAFVSAGSVVTKNVADYALVLGVPARFRSWISRHGQPMLKPTASDVFVCAESGLRYMLSQDGLLRCIDIPENQPLPEGLTTGKLSYRMFSTIREAGLR